jgi:hypothetical protein
MSRATNRTMTAVAFAPTDDELASTEHLRRWIVELDNLERLLAIQEQLLADGGPTDESQTAQAMFQPPTGLSMLPAELVPWATALAERNDDILRRARSMAAVAPRLVQTMHSHLEVVSVGFDTHA